MRNVSKTTMSMTAAFLMGGFCVLAADALPNLVKNPGFESFQTGKKCPNSTEVYGKLVCAPDSETFKEGTKSVRLTGTGSFVIRVRGLVPERPYKFSFYYKTKNGTFRMSACCRGAGYTMVGDPVGLMVSDDKDWEKFEEEFTAPKEYKEDFLIEFKIAAASGSVWLDQISVAPAPSADSSQK